jgi:endonuclease/exonuclease/phosphatase family metal-dependent hydrolase
MRWTAPVVIALGTASLAVATVASLPSPVPVGPYALERTARPADAQPVTVAVTPLAATVAVGPQLVFATFNVCKVDCAAPAPSWDVRRDRVARVIVESGLDVVGLQEVTFNPTSTAKTQLLDVQNLVAPRGFVSPTFTKDSDQCRWTAPGAKACTHTTGLLFNSATVRQATTPNGTPSAGTLPMSDIAAGLTPDAAPRKVTWAYLEGLNGTGPFLALSVHTESAKDSANEASRVAFGAALDGWVLAWDAAHGMTGVPTVLMADLNSYRKRQPEGVQQVLANGGWLDTATAPVKRNVEYSTINYNPLLGLTEQGFPPKPYQFRTSKKNPVLDATRIDYVLAKGAGLQAVDYEVVIRLNPDGTFNPDYQASDHQMVRASIAFPAAG